MKKYLSLLGTIIISSAFIVGVVSAATTISTNIVTEGTLSVTGTSTFSGNVGIGTSTPMAKLDIYGNLNVGTSSTSTLFVNTATGNIGVGTSTPLSGFDITGPNGYYFYGGNGDANLSNTISTLDKTFVLNYILASRVFAPNVYAKADINGDGFVNFLDRDLIGAVILGTLTSDQAKSGGKFISSTVAQPTIYGSFIVGNGYTSVMHPNGIFEVYQGANGPGLISVNSGSGNVTGVAATTTGMSTDFTVTFKVGDTITANGETHTISSITGDGTMVTDNWTNTATSVPYTLNKNGSRLVVKSDGNVGIGTTTPTASLQVTIPSANATTSLEVGKSGQNKGSCLVMYDDIGAVQYVSISGGSLIVSSVSCR